MNLEEKCNNISTKGHPGIDVKINEFFGDQTLRLEFPKGWRVSEVKMTGHEVKPLTDSQIVDSLYHPIGVRSISEMAKGKSGKIVITVDDLTRPTPVYRVLPFIIKELEEVGISDQQILVLGAVGTHHPMTLHDFSLKVGREVVARFDVVNHNPFDHFEELGKTSYGTPLKINYEFAKADLRIVVCGVKKHNFAGAGGAGKAVLPGVSSVETIAWNHTNLPYPLDDETADRDWEIDGNVPRADMQEAARIANVDFTVNCCYNNNRELIGLHAGDLDEAWQEAVKLCYKMHSCKPPSKRADIVVVNAYPSAIQGVDWSGALSSLREGGAAIAVCQHPYGPYAVHYLEERKKSWWSRNQGYPNRPWPVRQAKRIMIYTTFITSKERLRYHNRVEFILKWSEIIDELLKEYGDGASVIVYHNKLQFDTRETPLRI